MCFFALDACSAINILARTLLLQSINNLVLTPREIPQKTQKLHYLFRNLLFTSLVGLVKVIEN